MAVIQTIRTKYAKLTTIVIVVALLGFILMDFGKGGGGRSTTIGKINGTAVDYTEYDAAIQARENEIKQQNPNMTLSDQQTAQVRDQVWDQLVNAKLLSDIDKKLGIVVSKQELNDLLTGPNPDPQVRQAFTDPKTGQFNPQEVSAQIQKLRKDPKMKDQWDAFESELIKRRYTEKFDAMVKGAIYVPKFVLQAQLNDGSEMANVNYVKLPYTLIPDNQVKVSDAEIKAYMEKHPRMFEMKDDSRSIEYVAFKIVPSAADSAVVLKELDNLKTEFANATDVESFINRSSQSPVPPNYYTQQQLSGLPNAAELTAAPVNAVVGPFSDGQNFVIAKVLAKNSFPDSVKVRHILVQTKVKGQETLSDSAAKMRIDSAVALIKSGVSFDSVVQHYSDDAGSKATAGEYEFTLPQKGQISKEFGDFIFEGHTGNTSIVKVSNDNYSGYHYIEILNQSTPIPVTKLAFVSKSLSPSKATYDDLFSKATQFSSKVNNKEDFDKAAQESSVPTAVASGINKNSFLVNNLGSSKDLVKWTYDAKIGEVSPIYTVGDNYVVAKLKNIQNKGLVNITDETRPELSKFVMKNKKAKLLADKYKGTLASIATASLQTVVPADSVTFSRGISSLQGEERVTGYTFYKSFKENTVSPAIQGNEGVFYLTVLNRTKLPVNPQANLSNERMMMENNLKSNATQLITNGIKEDADVKDERAKLY